MHKGRKRHWLIINCAAKVTGVGFVAVGSILSVWAVIAAIASPQRLDTVEAILTIGSAVVVTALGALMLKAKPFRSDQ